MEYLGFWATREGVSPTAKQTEAILYMYYPRNKKEVCKFFLNDTLL